jgi:hypothetical protein
LLLKGNTAATWKKQQLWSPWTSCHSNLTSQFQLIFVDKYYSQSSHLVRLHQRLWLYANTRVGHLRNNSRTKLNYL